MSTELRLVNQGTPYEGYGYINIPERIVHGRGTYDRKNTTFEDSIFYNGSTPSDAIDNIMEQEGVSHERAAQIYNAMTKLKDHVIAYSRQYADNENSPEAQEFYNQVLMEDIRALAQARNEPWMLGQDGKQYLDKQISYYKVPENQRLDNMWQQMVEEEWKFANDYHNAYNYQRGKGMSKEALDNIREHDMKAHQADMLRKYGDLYNHFINTQGTISQGYEKIPSLVDEELQKKVNETQIDAARNNYFTIGSGIQNMSVDPTNRDAANAYFNYGVQSGLNSPLEAAGWAAVGGPSVPILIATAAGSRLGSEAGGAAGGWLFDKLSWNKDLGTVTGGLLGYGLGMKYGSRGGSYLNDQYNFRQTTPSYQSEFSVWDPRRYNNSEFRFSVGPYRTQGGTPGYGFRVGNYGIGYDPSVAAMGVKPSVGRISATPSKDFTTMGHGNKKPIILLKDKRTGEMFENGGYDAATGKFTIGNDDKIIEVSKEDLGNYTAINSKHPNREMAIVTDNNGNIIAQRQVNKNGFDGINLVTGRNVRLTGTASQGYSIIPERNVTPTAEVTPQATPVVQDFLQGNVAPENLVPNSYLKPTLSLNVNAGSENYVLNVGTRVVDREGNYHTIQSINDGKITTTTGEVYLDPSSLKPVADIITGKIEPFELERMRQVAKEIDQQWQESLANMPPDKLYTINNGLDIIRIHEQFFDKNGGRHVLGSVDGNTLIDSFGKRFDRDAVSPVTNPYYFEGKKVYKIGEDFNGNPIISDGETTKTVLKNYFKDNAIVLNAQGEGTVPLGTKIESKNLQVISSSKGNVQVKNTETGQVQEMSAIDFIRLAKENTPRENPTPEPTPPQESIFKDQNPNNVNYSTPLTPIRFWRRPIYGGRVRIGDVTGDIKEGIILSSVGDIIKVRLNNGRETYVDIKDVISNNLPFQAKRTGSIWFGKGTPKRQGSFTINGKTYPYPDSQVRPFGKGDEANTSQYRPYNVWSDAVWPRAKVGGLTLGSVGLLGGPAYLIWGNNGTEKSSKSGTSTDSVPLNDSTTIYEKNDTTNDLINITPLAPSEGSVQFTGGTVPNPTNVAVQAQQQTAEIVNNTENITQDDYSQPSTQTDRQAMQKERDDLLNENNALKDSLSKYK